MLAVAAMLSGASAEARDLAPVVPIAACEGLANRVVTAGDAPARIELAKVADADTQAPYCLVQGYVAPQVRFELRLPTTGWTQRLLYTGCGGFCGQLSIRVQAAEGCAPVTRGEFALVTSDLGHSAGVTDALWASGNPDGIRNYGHRGVHVVTLAAKAIIQTYYGQRPAYSYFSGCSDGGREGMMEAQRYPEDFDGIVAGAPVIDDTTNNSIYHAWVVQHLLAPGGKPRFSDAMLGRIADEVLRQCDARDSMRDGIVTDPEGCRPSFERLRCRSAGAGDCLSPEQIATLRALYTGPVDAAGKPLYVGHPVGSERSWNQWAQGSLSFATNFITYMTGQPFAGEIDVWKVGYTPQDVARFNSMAGEINAMDPDLGRFRARGGKLLMWHGWGDPGVPPGSSTRYFAAMRTAMGEAAMADFMRLYMLPGVQHCGGGNGPDRIDLLTPLMAWVEDGVAPGAVPAHALHDGKRRDWTIRPYPALPRAAR
jgi:feruloyl esterase